MKTLILLCSMVWATVCQAQVNNVQTLFVVDSGAPVACAACPSASDGADILCEDAEASEYTCSSSPTWTELTTGGTVDGDTPHSGSLACADKGTYALQISKTSHASITDEISWTDSTKIFAKFYINIVSETLANGESDEVMMILGDGTYIWRGYLYQNTSGILKIYFNGNGVGNGTEYTISTGTWYKIAVQLELPATGCPSSGSSDGIMKTWIDSTLVLDSTTHTNCNDYDKLRLGTYGTGADATWSIQFDNIKLDDDTLPSDCE